ncbi:MAG: glycosyltransferase [Deltaproteobacteria bacterium]
MAPKFVFNATGTRGDLIPLLAIAAEVQRRGHDVHVLANDPQGAVAGRFAVPFSSIAPAQVNNLTGIEDAFGKHVFPSYRPTFEFIEAALKRGTEVVLVSMECHTGAMLMAERHGLPLCRLALAPFRIFSLEPYCYPLSQRLQGPLAQTYRRYVLPRLRQRDYEHPYVLSGLNAFRWELGLAPIASVCELESRASCQLCLFPDWYCPNGGDSPVLNCVGFPLPRPDGELPGELSNFIDRNGEPIVFTPGTGVLDVNEFFAAARQCCAQLGRPGLFLSPSLPAQQRGANGFIYQHDYLDLALVLPRAALLVHHGGMGTTARALEAGVPQIISPPRCANILERVVPDEEQLAVRNAPAPGREAKDRELRFTVPDFLRHDDGVKKLLNLHATELTALGLRATVGDDAQTIVTLQPPQQFVQAGVRSCVPKHTTAQTLESSLERPLRPVQCQCEVFEQRSFRTVPACIEPGDRRPVETLGTAFLLQPRPEGHLARKQRAIEIEENASNAHRAHSSLTDLVRLRPHFPANRVSFQRPCSLPCVAVGSPQR